MEFFPYLPLRRPYKDPLEICPSIDAWKFLPTTQLIFQNYTNRNTVQCTSPYSYSIASILLPQDQKASAGAATEGNLFVN